MPPDLAEYRRKRRNAKTYRYQKKRRKQLKTELLAARGGCCEDCGYATATAPLEFHHRDPRSKEFRVSYGGVSRERLWAEAATCDLLCANCHRARHVAVPKGDEDPVIEWRRSTKERAVALLGARCIGCAFAFPRRHSSSNISTPARRTFRYLGTASRGAGRDRGRAHEVSSRLRQLPPRSRRGSTSAVR